MRRVLVRARAAARTRCARRAASTAPSTPRAKATRRRSTSSTRSRAATSSPTSRRSRRCATPRRASSTCSTAWACRSTRTAEGLIDFRRFGGTLHHRTAFAGATTGQQLLYALDEQVRRHEVAGKVRRFERHEFVARGQGRQRPLPRHRRDGPGDDEARHLPGGGGGAGDGRPGRRLRQVDQLGRQHRHRGRASSISRARIYANGEFIQVHPTAIAGPDKLRLISESLRGEGARVWVPKKKGDTRDAAADPRERALVLPRGEVPEVQEPGAARHRLARDLQGGAPRGARRRRQGRGLPRHRQPRPRRLAGPRARRDRASRRGRGRDLREVRRRRSAQDADAGLPGGALLDGRPVGRLRPDDQHPRPVCRR